MVPIAIGTQTTGSTIRPASFCGVFGYRPTYGEHRMHGVMEASGSLDTLGILARSVEDIALYRDVLLGIPPEPIAEDRAPPRIGALPHATSGTRSSRRHATLIEDAAQRLARAGARVTDVALPAEFERLNDAHRSISSFEFARTFTWEIENHWNEISDTLRDGRLPTASPAASSAISRPSELADDCRATARRAVGRHRRAADAGGVRRGAGRLAAFVGRAAVQIWTTLHVPAVSLPVFKGPDGMPIGAQLIATRHDDRKLFACARWAWRASKN